MPLPLVTLMASSLVFPSFQVQETGLEVFGVDAVAPGANAPFEFTDPVWGFGIQSRAVLVDPRTKRPVAGTTGRVRFRADDNEDGERRIFWEDVLASPGPAYLLARPAFGTPFEFGLGPYQSEIGLWATDTGTLHLRVFAPVTLNPVGLANTDQDVDKKLKYLFRAGAGGGVDATVGLGKFLIGARTQADYRWAYRGGEESLTHFRGEAEWVLDVGVGLKTSDTSALYVTGFFQDWWQWTYDGPTDDVGRGNQVIGGRLTLRTYTPFESSKPAPAPPAAPPKPLGKPTSGGG